MKTRLNREVVGARQIEMNVEISGTVNVVQERGVVFTG